MIVPFVGSGIIWGISGLLITLKFAHTDPVRAAQWMLGLWALSMLNLTAVGKAVDSVLALAASETTPEKRAALIIRASYWGLIKLVCLGLLGTLLMNGRAIPAVGMLPGTATMVVVPLLGGFWWSQRILRHA